MTVVGATLAGAFIPDADPWRAQALEQGPVYVVLWFDTEDYILPQSDDSAKRIAAYLTQQGVRATFKVVGEKARTLERRGRRDVIGALAQHEIGYHSNTHSQHPTVAEYESPLDWQAGVEEFDRRERPGFDDVRRILGKAPTCYGQPGSSWAPQVFPALRKWGVNIYLDEAPHVGLDGKPFWYGGLLNIFNTKEGPELRPNDDWSNLDQAKAKFQEFYVRLGSQPGGGILSLYFHPCEFIHQQFWDATNFARGLNPPREDWKAPPMKPPEESDRAYQYLAGLVTTMKSFPQVRFVTASEAFELFPDAAQNREFSMQEVNDIAGQVDSEVSFQTHQNYALSPSETFAVLNQFVSGLIRKRATEPLSLERTPYGPDSSVPELRAAITVAWSQFSRTAVDVAGFLGRNGQIPPQVWLGGAAVPPESYLVALAQATGTLIAKNEPPGSVTCAPAHLATSRYVAEDSPSLWNWPIFPPGFRSPHLMELARLQAWTLKPARLRGTT
jgi:peptidoglycan/xylan/chitin deacetylase (PgdA/CDA1 family)